MDASSLSARVLARASSSTKSDNLSKNLLSSSSLSTRGSYTTAIAESNSDGGGGADKGPHHPHPSPTASSVVASTAAAAASASTGFLSLFSPNLFSPKMGSSSTSISTNHGGVLLGSPYLAAITTGSLHSSSSAQHHYSQLHHTTTGTNIRTTMIGVIVLVLMFLMVSTSLLTSVGGEGEGGLLSVIFSWSPSSQSSSADATSMSPLGGSSSSHLVSNSPYHIRGGGGREVMEEEPEVEEGQNVEESISSSSSSSSSSTHSSSSSSEPSLSPKRRGRKKRVHVTSSNKDILSASSTSHRSSPNSQTSTLPAEENLNSNNNDNNNNGGGGDKVISLPNLLSAPSSTPTFTITSSATPSPTTSITVIPAAHVGVLSLEVPRSSSSSSDSPTPSPTMAPTIFPIHSRIAMAIDSMLADTPDEYRKRLHRLYMASSFTNLETAPFLRLNATAKFIKQARERALNFPAMPKEAYKTVLSSDIAATSEGVVGDDGTGKNLFKTKVWEKLTPRGDAGDTSRDPPDHLWDSETFTPTLSSTPAEFTARTSARLEWHLQCRTLSRGLLSNQQAPPSTTFRKGYMELKETAFRIYDALRHVWDPPPTGARPVDVGFHAGPWIEEYFYYTFGQPVRRTMSLVEWHYQARRLAGKGIRLISPITLSPPADIRSSQWANDDVQRLTQPQREAYDKAHEAMRRAEFQDVGESAPPHPVVELKAAIDSGMPMVEVEEFFDFDLFYPYVPIFIPWERLAIAQSRGEFDLTDAPNPASGGGGGGGGTHPGIFCDSHPDQLNAQRIGPDGVHPHVRFTEHILLDLAPELTQYITVVQRAAGIQITHQGMQRIAKDTILINAGGGGDIPIPLLAKQRRYMKEALPFGKHLWWMSFLGHVRDGVREITVNAALRHGFLSVNAQNPDVTKPYFLSTVREEVITVAGGGTTIVRLPQAPQNHGAGGGSGTGGGGHGEMVTTLQVKSWVSDMTESLLQLAPRGTNPTSFRLYEALQMGLTPVYVWDGLRPWLPYQDPTPLATKRKEGKQPAGPAGDLNLPEVDHLGGLWDRIAFIVHVNEFDGFLDALPILASESAWYESTRAAIAEARDAYFTYDAVIRHIYRLLLDPTKADLQCSGPAQVY